MLARRSLLTEGIIFLLSIVWLEAVNVTQPCTGLREMSGVKPARFTQRTVVHIRNPATSMNLKEEMGQEVLFCHLYVAVIYLFLKHFSIFKVI